MELDPPDEFFELTAEDLQRLQAQAAAKRKVCIHVLQNSSACMLSCGSVDMLIMRRGRQASCQLAAVMMKFMCSC
jgi:hypothetical protein